MTTYWVSHGKHYCEYCNANIQNHKQAIANHENSAHHKANVQNFLETKKRLRENDDKKQAEVMAEIVRVTMAASDAEGGGGRHRRRREASPLRADAAANAPAPPPSIDPNFHTRQASNLALFYANNSDLIDQLHAQHSAQDEERKRKEQEELEQIRQRLLDQKRKEQQDEDEGEEDEAEMKKREDEKDEGYSAPMPGKWQVVKPQAPAEPAYDTKVIVVPRLAPPEGELEEESSSEDEFVKQEEDVKKEEEDVPAESVVFAKRRTGGATKQIRRERIGHE